MLKLLRHYLMLTVIQTSLKMLALNEGWLLLCSLTFLFLCMQTAGWSALHFAAKSANLRITKLLLQKGADTELRDKVSWPLSITEDCLYWFCLFLERPHCSWCLWGWGCLWWTKTPHHLQDHSDQHSTNWRKGEISFIAIQIIIGVGAPNCHCKNICEF